MSDIIIILLLLVIVWLLLYNKINVNVKIELSKMYVPNVDDVKNLLKVSKPKAYEIIRTLNAELKDKGYLTVQGKIREDYLLERMGA